MASFDFIDSAVKGYKFAWVERGYIARLALPLLVIKFASFIFISSAGLEGNVLRQGLVYLPSYFVEGWLLAQLIRLSLFGERWPVPSSEASKDFVLGRSRAVQAGMAVYVMIQMFMTLALGLIAQNAPAESQRADLPEPTFGTFVAGIIALAVIIWGFRLLWLYIPAAMDYSVTLFLKKAGGYMTSLYMIGVWLVCLLPPAVLAVMVSELIYSAFGSEVSTLYRYTMYAFRAFTEIVVVVIATIGMAHGIRAIISGATDEARD